MARIKQNKLNQIKGYSEYKSRRDGEEEEKSSSVASSGSSVTSGSRIKKSKLEGINHYVPASDEDRQKRQLEVVKENEQRRTARLRELKTQIDTYESASKELSNIMLDANGLVENPDRIRELSKQVTELGKTIDDVKKEYKILSDDPNVRNATLKDMTVNALKRGYYNTKLGMESYADMMGDTSNEKQKYTDILAGDDYQYENTEWWHKLIGGAFEQAGQWGGQIDERAVAMGTGFAGGAWALGQAGPQIAAPEEVISVPGAFATGLKTGMAYNAYESEAGHAYNTMREIGVSEDTARAVAIAVGGGIAALEAAQLDEVVKGFKVLDATGADDTLMKRLGKELLAKGIDVAKETGQEVLQEGLAIGGETLASKYDTGKWAYTWDEAGERLKDTAIDSALAFAGLNVPATAKNFYQTGRDYQAGSTIKDMGDDTVQAIIEEGLATPEDSDAHKKAVQLQQKLESGKEVTPLEITDLYKQNVKDVKPVVEEASAEPQDPLEAAAREVVARDMEMAQEASLMEKNTVPLNVMSDNNQEAKVRRATAKYVVERTGYGEAGSKALASIIELNEANPAEVQARFDTPYKAGLTGLEKSKANLISPLQEAAYDAGRRDHIASMNEARTAVIRTGKEAGFDFTAAPKDIADADKRFTAFFASKMGVKGNWNGKDGKAEYNAFLDTAEGTVTFAQDFGISTEKMKQLGSLDYMEKVERLSSQRKNSFIFYVAHEIATHQSMRVAPKQTKAFVHAMYNYLADKAGRNLAMEKQAGYAQNGKKLSLEEAMEEVVADHILDLYRGDKQAFMAAMRKIATDLDAKQGAKHWYDGISNVIRKLKAWVKKLTGQENAEARAKMQENISELEAIRDLFEQAVSETMKAVQQATKTKRDGKLFRTVEADGSVVFTTSVGNPVAMMDENGSAVFSLKTYESFGRAELKRWLDLRVSKGQLDQADASDLVKQLDEYFELCQDFKDKYAPFGAWSNAEVVRDNKGKPVFSVVKANGEYAMNLDFSLVCKKRRTLDAVFKEMIRRNLMDNVSLEEADIAKVNEIIRESGFETACALCFVDSKRYRQAKVADTFVSQYNDMVNLMLPDDGSLKAHYFDFVGTGNYKNRGEGLHTATNAQLQTGIEALKQVMRENGKQTVAHKIAKHLLNNPQDRRLVTRSEFMNTDGFEAVKIKNPNVLKLYNSSKGAGGPKAAFSDVQYLGDILKKNNFTPARAYAVGGVRIQSFSDYIPRLVFDYLQMTADLAAKKLPAHAYTKEAIFVKQFGMTGIKMNMSLVPAIAQDGVAPGLDKNGDYYWFDGQSFGSDVKVKGSGNTGFELAKQIQNAPGYSQHCGTIAVGVSDQHIWKMLDDPDIRMIIPYHKSSLNHIVAMLNNIDKYVDYTGVQNTRNADGTKISGKDFNFNEALLRTGDAKAAANEYLAWCEKNNYIPKFDSEGAKFSEHENYYKMLEDFSTYDNGKPAPQGAVTMTFPKKGDAFGSMAELIEQGLEEDAILEARRSKQVPEIVDKVEKVLKKRDNKQYSLKDGERKKATDYVNQAETRSEAAVRMYETDGVRYSMKELSAEETPKKTKTAYKLFRVEQNRPGEIFPLFVGAEDSVPIGKWIAAEDNESVMALGHWTGKGKDKKFVEDKKRRVKSKIGESWLLDPSQFKEWKQGKTYAVGSRVQYNGHVYTVSKKSNFVSNVPPDVKGSGWRQADTMTTMAYRPGWHSGDAPYLEHIGKKPEGAKKVTHYSDNHIWAEVEVPDDIDYQPEANKRGMDANGRIREKFADLDYIPTGGNYDYKTNSNMLGKWVISGAVRVTRILSDAETRQMLATQFADRGLTQRQRMDDAGNVVGDIDLEKYGFEEGKKYSLKDSEGYAPAFYSQMERTIEAVKQDKLGAASVVSMLRGKGVKAEEIKWSGIEAFLEGKKSVTKQELLEFVRANSLEIQEIAKDGREADWSAEDIEARDAAMKKAHAGLDVFKAEWRKEFGNELEEDSPFRLLRGGIRDAISYEKARATRRAVAKAENNAVQVLGAHDFLGYHNEDGAADLIKSAIGLGLPDKEYLAYLKVMDRTGGRLYGELTQEEINILLECKRAHAAAKEAEKSFDSIALRMLDVAEPIREADAVMNKLYNKYHDETTARKTKWEQYTLDGGENYREYLFKMPGSVYDNDAMQAHWGYSTSGILAHARVQDFDVAGGGKMLFIEEIQSDWHNAGRKQGYARSEAEVRAAEKRAEELKEKKWTQRTDLIKDIRDHLTAIGTDSPDIVARNVIRSPDLADSFLANGSVNEALANRIREYHKLRAEADAAWQEVFAEENKVPDAPYRNSYHEFVLKNLLRKAAEGGYDYLGWTTGKMQEERWSSDYAEGYRIEYDQDIPKFLNKYGKQWGASVSRTPLNGVERENAAYDPYDEYDLRILAIKKLTEDDPDLDADQLEADVEPNRDSDDERSLRVIVTNTDDWTQWEMTSETFMRGTSEEVWSIPITDAMKQSVLYEGQPKFSLKDSDYMKAVESGDMETAQRMVDEAAKAAGYNHRGVHRAKTAFTVFDRKKIGSGAGTQLGDGFYVTLEFKDKATADYADSAYGKVKMDLHVKMRSPLVLGKPISDETIAKMAEPLVWFDDDDSAQFGTMPKTIQRQLESGESSEQLEAIHWLAQNASMEISELLKGAGIDGVISENEYVAQAVVWDENQLKSADPVTYDDNGNAIPLSERFKLENDDIRYSLKAEEEMRYEIEAIRREGKKAGKTEAQIDSEVAAVVGPQYAELIKAYGEIKKGEKAYRDITVPERTDRERYVSQTVRTALEAEVTPDAAVPTIEELIAKGDFSYDRITDKAAMKGAKALVARKGFATALMDWTKDVRDGKVSKANTAIGWTLYNEAANAGDLKTAMTILNDMVKHQRSAAQAVQASRILKKMSPEAQLYGIQKTVEEINEELKQKRGQKDGKQGVLNDENVPVEEWMQKTGEMLAKQLGNAVKQKSRKEKTVSMQILADLRKLAKETVTPAAMPKATRTEMDAIYDMFNNREHYEEALAAAKETVAQEYGDDPAIMAALDRWMQTAFDYTAQFTKEFTGQTEIQIPQELVDKFLSQADQEGRDKVAQEIYRYIGSQVPSTFMDKWNAWRYLAMLGNPRTHVRNVLGNAFFAPVVMTKNLTATAIEGAVSFVSGGKIDRTKGAISPKLLKAAWADYANVADEITAGGKYSDAAMKNQYIQEGRRIFKTKPLEWARKGNSKLLEKEDMWFAQPHYAFALAQYCAANGVTVEQLQKGKALGNARAYAIKEAQKATYRDTNAFSQMVSGWGRYNGDNAVYKAASTVIEGILPFRKTPANILVRGMEYSPIGLMKSITVDLVRVKNGDITAAEMIDNFSAGMTGTGLLAAGMYLAAQGLIRGAGGSDDEEKKFDELQGHQTYALELPDGTSVTLDWLAPEVLPLFIGVNLVETAQESKDGYNMADMLTAVSNVTEPLLEMSCLQSLNDLFDSVAYSGQNGLSALPTILVSAATSYLTQAFPTILGQAERTSEEQRMTTYTEKNSFLTSDMQYLLGKVSAKMPNWDFQQIPYIDAWGRKEASGDTGTRAFNNFLNPAYTSEINTSAMERELQRLYEDTGEGSVLPDRAAKYFTVNKERKDLTAEEYVKYATEKGKLSYSLLSKLTSSSAYKDMSDTDRVEAVEMAYDYANAIAKTKVSAYTPDSWIKKAQATNRNTGLGVEKYIALYMEQKDIVGLKDSKGETIDNSRGLLVMDMVYNTSGLSSSQKAALLKDFGVGSKIIKYSPAKVRQELNKLRRK